MACPRSGAISRFAPGSKSPPTLRSARASSGSPRLRVSRASGSSSSSTAPSQAEPTASIEPTTHPQPHPNRRFPSSFPVTSVSSRTSTGLRSTCPQASVSPSKVWAAAQNKIHDLQTHLDPILSLHDSSGRELATADNNHYAIEPWPSRRCGPARTHLQVRDTTYGGDPAWGYALLATPGPVTTSTYPLAANPGARPAMLELHGPGIDPQTKSPSRSPEESSSPASTSSHCSIPRRVRCRFPCSSPRWIVLETADAPSVGDKEKPFKLPAALCGRLAEPGDQDAYRFE